MVPSEDQNEVENIFEREMLLVDHEIKNTMIKKDIMHQDDSTNKPKPKRGTNESRSRDDIESIGGKIGAEEGEETS